MQSFNSAWYLQNNPDVAAALAAGIITSAEAHFEQYGQFEGRSPSPIFDQEYYLEQNPDVAAALEAGIITSAYQHFVQYGQEEMRSASPFFNPSLYLALNPDVAAAEMNPYEHFETYGYAEPRSISAFFDVQAYLEANPDVAEAIENGVTTAYEHFVTYGFQEGRDLGNGLSLAQFANDPVAQAALAAGDFSALAARVAEVAPFIEGYEPPAGYTIPANTPIPLDFVPVEGETLIIPEGVTVPPGTELPDTIEPLIERSFGMVDELAQGEPGYMKYGTLNSADNFNIVRHNGIDVELALKAKEFGPNGGDYADSAVEVGADGVAHFYVSTGASPDNANRADWSFDYAATNLSPDSGDAFKFAIAIDTDKGVGVKMVEYDVSTVVNTQDSSNYGFNYIRSQIDNDPEQEGIQPYDFSAGQFDVELRAYDGATLVAKNNIVVHVGDGLLI
jgi:hypothetical protein